jgi:hypothetical protein
MTHLVFYINEMQQSLSEWDPRIKVSPYDLDHFAPPIFKEDGLLKVDLNLLPSVSL